MDSLPTELRQLIFEDLVSLHDLRSVRLLIKHYRDLISPRLFRRIMVTTRAESYERAVSVCRSQVAKYVQCLHYNLLDVPLICQAEWDATLTLLQRIERKENLNDAFVTYEEYKIYHHGRISSDESVPLKKSLEKFPP